LGKEAVWHRRPSNVQGLTCATGLRSAACRAKWGSRMLEKFGIADPPCCGSASRTSIRVHAGPNRLRAGLCFELLPGSRCLLKKLETVNPENPIKEFERCREKVVHTRQFKVGSPVVGAWRARTGSRRAEGGFKPGIRICCRSPPDCHVMSPVAHLLRTELSMSRNSDSDPSSPLSDSSWLPLSLLCKAAGLRGAA
jgi:hypothetical protein